MYEPVLELVFPVLEEELRDIDARAELVQAISRRDAGSAQGAAERLLAKGTVAMSAALEILDGGGD